MICKSIITWSTSLNYRYIEPKLTIQIFSALICVAWSLYEALELHEKLIFMLQKISLFSPRNINCLKLDNATFACIIQIKRNTIISACLFLPFHFFFSATVLCYGAWLGWARFSGAATITFWRVMIFYPFFLMTIHLKWVIYIFWILKLVAFQGSSQLVRKKYGYSSWKFSGDDEFDIAFLQVCVCIKQHVAFLTFPSFL